MSPSSRSFPDLRVAPFSDGAIAWDKAYTARLAVGKSEAGPVLTIENQATGSSLLQCVLRKQTLTSASAILSVDLTNRFFYIGKGLPFYYGVRGFRTIFFGVMADKMYINWLVLTAYNVVFAPLGLWLVVRRVWSQAEKGTAGRPGSEAAVAGVALLGAGAAV
ncbi:hypothetical protein TSOC_005394 [Tetrabaena socialis]|uniref:DUF3533 domain-containing protein n=1 Tax=Tetrabaena socialis TaxID=47790 RepID=A0A2J8A6B9_9CHLO|nr:hypothetical protein TSOC_005394 [Tetrabaena socialis]|eukprot:PNH08076.1 hypothetical protein TSOC_005394 [Tetrabaena socialis]